ncbi:MAG: M48 family metalloprotease [Chloroflexi bacterium]|nr:M48 family metalloprotease [Chloroflexota bacterium]
MFTHELYHFKNGDYWQMGYARALLQAVATFMLWAMAFLMGYGFFLLVVKPDFIAFDYPAFIEQVKMFPAGIGELYLPTLPPAEEVADLQQKAASLNIFSVITFAANATLPFILVGGILWLFYWRKLLRIREFYADAGVAHTQKNIDSLCYAFILGSRAKPDTGKAPTISLWNKVKSRIKEIGKQIKSALAPPTFVRKWFSTHPEFKRRIEALENPTRAYDHWLVTALSLGGIALILDILLATPLTLPYQGQWPMHFSVLVISVVVTLALMTPLVLGKSVYKSMLKIIGVVVALRFVWLMLTLGLMWVLLILAPDLLEETLDAAIMSIARSTGFHDGPIVEDLTSFVLQASFVNIAQVFIVLISLVLLIGSNMWLLRRLFTWYSFPQNEQKRQLVRIAYGIIAVTTTSFGLSILTPITAALLRSDDTSILLLFLVAACGFVIAAVGLGWFFYTDHKYARRCTCGESVPGPYHLGKRCNSCKQLLHRWLIAEYEL